MLTMRSRLLLGLASLLLLGMFAFPLWRVSLSAPQYPEGLGMEIHINTVRGVGPNDLANINNLNHYIGMKRIEPSAIPELRYMPWIVAGLVALGLGAAVTGRRGVARTFVGLFVALAIVGLVDFWRWEYDYGHDLDLVNTIIKIPGMSYQPPLIGTRQLLNFTATSMPAAGALFAFAAAAVAMAALALPFRARPTTIAAALLFVTASAGAQPAELRVGAGERYTRVSDAIAAAPPFARVLVRAGTYQEPPLVVTRPLALVGEPGARLDGGGTHTILLVEADDVSVEGLTFANTGATQVEERAGIRVRNARRCRIARSTFDRTAFAIYLERSVACEIRHNEIRGTGAGQMATGNGIHAWNSDSVVIRDNVVRGHRDGIYFEFVTGGVVERNHSEGSARYGLHFMFSNDCDYRANTFRANGNGVAVMYSRGVTMTANTFERNRGSAAYGLLLKDINDSRVSHNRFIGNSVGLYLEDAGRNHVRENVFRDNGWALKVLASAQGNVFAANVFEHNAFDVGTNSRSNYSTFRGNQWDRYAGYDLDRDGVGDIPHTPVRLFALVVEQSPASLILLRSPLVDLIDLAERVFPALTPAEVNDPAPALTRPRGAPR